MAWAPDYIETDDIADYLNVTEGGAQVKPTDEAVFAMAISAASRAVDRACNRQFGQVPAPEARTYRPRYDDEQLAWVLDVDDLGDLTGATIGGIPITTAACYPRNALVKGSVFTEIQLANGTSDEVVVTARWGWPSVPAVIKQATLLQASRLVGRRDSPFGVAGNAEAGAERIVSAKVDPDVAVLVRTLYRWWGAY